MEVLNVIERQKFQLSLKDVSIRQLLLFSHAPCTLYIFERGEYIPLFQKGESLTKKLIQELISSGRITVYCKKEDQEIIKKKVEKDLLTCSRGLSSGNAYNNASKLLTLLTLNFEILYSNPFDTEALMLQYKSFINLKHFIENNYRYVRKLYQDYQKQQLPYVYSQPILSSLLLLSYLQKNRIYTGKDSEQAFLASAFKDIGMSMIPEETHSQNRLSQEYKHLLAQHPQFSYQILKAKIPFEKNWMMAIAHHHHLSTQIPGAKVNYDFSKSHDTIVGFETILLGFFDTFTAMTSKRPYRSQLVHFQALDDIGAAMSPWYKGEFNSFVKFLFQFFG